MELTLLSGQSHPQLAAELGRSLGTPLCQVAFERFPDGEMHVEISQSVRGHDVYIVQATSEPAEAHLFELLLAADACRRAGAQRITAVIPYLAYARQDRRASAREAVAASVVAQMIGAGRFERLVAVDMHSTALEGFFDLPVEHLSAISLLAEAIRAHARPNAVVVAPDLGASKLAARFGQLLDLPVAIVHKARLTAHDVSVTAISGDVQGRQPIIVDDMISTGGTVHAAADAALARGAAGGLIVAVSHALLVGDALARLRELPLERLICTDSVPRKTAPAGLAVETVSVAPLLAEAVRRLHADESMAELIRHD